MDGGVEVYWARNAGDAHLVAGLLEADGIRADVINEMLQAGAGELPLGPSSAPRVVVAVADAARAQAIVQEWERRPKREPSETWRCGECGEQVDFALDACDYCYTPRGEAKPERDPEIRAAHAAVLFVVWMVAAILTGFVLAAFDLPYWVVVLLADLVSAVVAIRLTRTVFGGSLGARGRAMVGLVPVGAGPILAGVVGGFGVAAAYFVAAHTILPPDESGIDHFTALGLSSPFGFGVWVLLAVVVAPFVEEFVFRGVMLEGFRKRLGWTGSVLLVTTLFVLVHVHADVYAPWLPFAAAAGVVAALLRIRTGSLYPAVAAHFCHNLFMAIWLYLDAAPGW